ncbi:MAG: VWA domain-containing protein [Putridiphycobacter sp.]
MKTHTIKSIFVLVFFFNFNFLFGQGTLKLGLQVYDKKHQPKSNLRISLVETTTFQTKAYTTNADGKLVISLDEGQEWVLNIGEMRGYSVLKVPQHGGVSTASATVTYDLKNWERINQKPVNRDKISLKTVPQIGISSASYPQKGFTIVELIVRNGKGQTWNNVTAKLVSYDLKTQYTAKTNSQGMARFYVPNNQNYQIDLDGEVDFSYVDVGNQSGIRTLDLLYEKIDFIEKVNSKGYIEQVFHETPKPASNRVLVKLQIIGGPNEGKNEDVYLDMNYSNNKYHGKTNSNGEVIFMLPKKKGYTLSFNYQKGAYYVDLTRIKGIGEYYNTFQYIPDDRLLHPEKYLPSKDNLKIFDINAFNQKQFQDTPDDNLINVHAKWGSQKINSGSREALLELGFSVKNRQINRKNIKPLNLSFVLDKSGSMSGENIDILKASMLGFISKLRPIDKVSIIYFNDKSVLAYPHQSVQQDKLKDIIYALKADGGTNIFDGLKMGYESVDKNFNPNGINRVILLTDGYGSKPVDFILDQSKKYFEKGIAVSTIGVGIDHNQNLLELVSKYSGGLNHQVVESEGIDAALIDEFENLKQPLATNLNVVVKYNNKIIYKSLHGVPEVSNTNSKVKFNLQHVNENMNQLVLMKFKLNEPNKNIENDVVTITTSYYDETNQKAVEFTKEMHLEWSDESNIEMIYDQNIKRAYTVSVINQCMKVIADYCENKNYEAAEKNIIETLKQLDKLNSTKYDPDLLPIIELLKEYLMVLENIE